MFRKLFLGVVALNVLAGTVLTAGYLSLKAPAAKSQVPAVNEAQRYLLAAAREGDTDRVVGLLQAGTSPDTRDEQGFTPLILAAYNGNLLTARALMRFGADACAGDARGNTALMGAAFKGHAGVVKLLSEQPCAVDQTNQLGQTALMFASLFGRQLVAEELRQHGASPALRDASGHTAEDWARWSAPPPPPIALPGLPRDAAARSR